MSYSIPEKPLQKLFVHLRDPPVNWKIAGRSLNDRRLKILLRYTPENYFNYLLILKIALSITIISFIIEFMFPFLKNMDEIKHIIGVFIFRFIHFTAFAYYSLFVLVFKIYNKNGDKRGKVNIMIYLLLVLLMELSWKIYKYCPASYYEFKMYGVDENNYSTTFHPSLYSIFREHSDYIIYISGFAMVVNVLYIMYNEKWIDIKFRTAYFIIFGYLFLNAFVENRL
jgi:hypothetical protein